MSCRGGILVLGGVSHAIETHGEEKVPRTWPDAWVYDLEHGSGWHPSHRGTVASRVHHTLHAIRDSHVATDTMREAIPEPEEAFLVFGGVHLPAREPTGGAWVYHILPRPSALPMPEALQLTEEAALVIVRVERERNKLKSLDLRGCNIGPSGAAEIADGLKVMAVLTSLE